MTPPVFAHGHLRLYLLSLLAESVEGMHGYELMQALGLALGTDESVPVFLELNAMRPCSKRIASNLGRSWVVPRNRTLNHSMTNGCISCCEPAKPWAMTTTGALATASG